MSPYSTAGEQAQRAAYQERCTEAARQQGLDPPSATLREAGFTPKVLQTGGFVMVLEAYHDEDANIQVWVTQEEFDDEDNPLYLVCSYTVPNPSADYTGTYDGEEEIECVYDVSLSDVPSTVSRLINNNNN